jgi:hypothetical protein
MGLDGSQPHDIRCRITTASPAITEHLMRSSDLPLASLGGASLRGADREVWRHVVPARGFRLDRPTSLGERTKA